MLTLPKVVERAAQPYVAIPANVVMPFGEAIDKAMPEVGGWLERKGIAHGPAMFRYTLIDMPRLGMEFGFVLDEPVTGEGNVFAGLLPAGRYVTTTYWGHYDDLMGVTGMLIGWTEAMGLRFDSEPGPDGERFASRLELYPNGPMDEPDPAKWETQLLFKLRH